MKRSELKQMINEELKKTLNEAFEFEIKNSFGKTKIYVGDRGDDGTVTISQDGKKIYFSSKDFKILKKELNDLGI